MRIPFGALVFSAGLMLATVVHANMSALDPENFLEPYGQNTLALIAEDLAELGQAEPVAALPQEEASGRISVQEPQAAALEATPPVEAQAEIATMVQPTPEAHETDTATAPQTDLPAVEVEATGSLPAAAVIAPERDPSAGENEEVAMSRHAPVDETSNSGESMELMPILLP